VCQIPQSKCLKHHFECTRFEFGYLRKLKNQTKKILKTHNKQRKNNKKLQWQQQHNRHRTKSASLLDRAAEK